MRWQRDVRRCRAAGDEALPPPCLPHTRRRVGAREQSRQTHGGRVTVGGGTVHTEQKQKTHTHKYKTQPPLQAQQASTYRCKSASGQTHHHVRVVDDGINVICGLNQGKAAVPQRNNTGVHADACKEGSHGQPEVNRESGVILYLQCSDWRGSAPDSYEHCSLPTKQCVSYQEV